MIDFTDLHTMKEIAQLSRKHVATIWRWALRGVKGEKLETILIGGQRYVSRAALASFVEKLNSETKPTSACRVASAETDAALDAAGISAVVKRNVTGPGRCGLNPASKRN
jgi:Protein of unknown function (DUF1580)